ncbi:MAG: PP2C family protein-serine/threonine phosphatase [Melioribacteraceae bacterium]|nr:PP2C family protein-serine/threonine phosphatase [Melioribacteraceae bacterium]MCF8355295.1 PP2C family protein-serine/threonine phosphatase [Melioribacteraceae bacterium]MCF8394141.1 PP2C family protein-serine/threonine phosphatase [Melioribacteraceae bacterium]MCF8418120.1 PP2C family protein-serine/threonine phosphatase [Melioribacteraceae bacterium]
MNEKLKAIIENKDVNIKDAESHASEFIDIITHETGSDDFALIFNSNVYSASEKLKSIIEKVFAAHNNQIKLDGYDTISSDTVKLILIINSSLKKSLGKKFDLIITIIELLYLIINSESQSSNTKKILDSKVEQLNQLYELSKEFSGILELDYVSKLLIFSIVGQFLVSNFAIYYFDKDINVLESSIDKVEAKKLIAEFDYKKLTEEKFTEGNFPEIYTAGFHLALPMQIKNETKGLILLGEKKNKEKFSKYDIEYINSVGSLAIISIENSILFKEALEKQAIERDLETARIIQKNLLPREILQPEGYQISAYSESAKQVGGDYFDLLKNADNETIFAMGDVSGKGITASLLVANSQAYLKSISKLNLPIHEATGLLNDLVEESTVSGTYITFFWGTLNSKRELTYVNAGHNPPLLIRNGEIRKLDKGGLILGMLKTMMPYESETIQLQTGDYIITFTDGVTEAMNSAEEEYSDEKLEEICCGLKNESADEAKELILNDVKNFTAGFEQSDDLTLLIIKVT